MCFEFTTPIASWFCVVISAIRVSRAIFTCIFTAVVRERDELIARMDAKERLDYDRESNQNYRNTADSVENSLAEVSVQIIYSCSPVRINEES